MNFLTEMLPPRIRSKKFQKSLVANEFDGNKIATPGAVLDVMDAMKSGRYETGEELQSRESNRPLGALATKQVIEVHHYLPEGASGVVIQGRGIGAGVSDESYGPNKLGKLPLMEKGMDAAFASAIAAGLTDDAEHPMGIILPTLPGQAADTHHNNDEQYSNELSKTQKKALWHGDNRPIGEAQANAILNVLDSEDQKDVPIHIIGSSLSTAQAPEMARTLLLQGANVATINLLEAVTVDPEKRKFFGISLLPEIIKASLKFGIYLDANHKIYQYAKEEFGNGELRGADGIKKLLGVTARYAISLHGDVFGTFRDKEFIDKANEKGTVINLAYGTASEFKTAKQCERAAESLRKLGYKNVITTPFKDGIHAVSVSGPAFVKTVEESIKARDEAVLKS